MVKRLVRFAMVAAVAVSIAACGRQGVDKGDPNLYAQTHENRTIATACFPGFPGGWWMDVCWGTGGGWDLIEHGVHPDFPGIVFEE